MSNSLLINNKMLMVPKGLIHFQAPGSIPDFAAGLESPYLKIYQLPDGALFDQIDIGDATCLEIGVFNMHQLCGTVEFFVGRKYGVIDVYSYDVATRTLENIVYYPILTVGEVEQLWYS